RAHRGADLQGDAWQRDPDAVARPRPRPRAEHRSDPGPLRPRRAHHQRRRLTRPGGTLPDMTDAFDTRTYETLRVERRGAVAWIWLHRPERYHAFTKVMCDELSSVWRALRTDDDIRSA